MNYVAHQFLSFRNPEIQIGNLYGEIVRGKNLNDYESGIRRGILLHREIDSFTDSHPLVKNSSQKFHERFGKYAPVIVDVLYDYLLIRNWENYSFVSFDEFVNNCYELFRLNFDLFPAKLQYIVKHLLEHDWFRNYSTIEGVGLTLRGISQRSKFPNEIELATKEIEIYLSEFEADFFQFFPEISSHCKAFLDLNH